MNRSKRLCALLGVLVAVCGATLILLHTEERREKIKNSGEVILEIPGDAVTALSWEYGGTALAFHREEAWVYDRDGAFPVSGEKIGELLEQFRSFRAAFVIEDVEDYGQYGLDNPICTIDISTEERSYRILLGDYSQMDSQRYVSIGDGNAYLAQSDPLDCFDVGLNQLMENDRIPGLEHVTELRFAGDENYSVVYEEDSPNARSSADVYFVRQNGKNLPLDTSRVDSYLWLIRSMSLNNCVSYSAAEEELSSYGLDDPDLSVSVTYIPESGEEEPEENTFTLHISRDAETKKAMAEAEKREDDGGDDISAAYVRVDGSRIIYEISADRYRQLMAAACDDLRHTSVFWADFADVYQIDISLDGSLYTFISKEDGGQRIWSYQGEELEIGDLRSALESLTAETFSSELPAQKREIGLTLFLDNEHFPEIRVELYRCDGRHCLAVVDGESVSLVARSGVVDLTEAVRAVVLH